MRKGGNGVAENSELVKKTGSGRRAHTRANHTAGAAAPPLSLHADVVIRLAHLQSRHAVVALDDQLVATQLGKVGDHRNGRRITAYVDFPCDGAKQGPRPRCAARLVADHLDLVDDHDVYGSAAIQARVHIAACIRLHAERICEWTQTHKRRDKAERREEPRQPEAAQAQILERTTGAAAAKTKQHKAQSGVRSDIHPKLDVLAGIGEN